MTNPALEKWNTRYRDAEAILPSPSEVLAENRHLLPARGTALDLACGFAGNAVLLAQYGLQTFAWDFSPVLIEKLSGLIGEHGLPLSAEVRDVVEQPPEAARFDVIVVSRFLERRLSTSLTDALKPGGLLFYQTFIKAKIDDSGPNDPDFLLDDNELLHMFVPPLALRVYREEARLGDTTRGFRNSALLVGQKR